MMMVWQTRNNVIHNFILIRACVIRKVLDSKRLLEKSGVPACAFADIIKKVEVLI